MRVYNCFIPILESVVWLMHIVVLSDSHGNFTMLDRIIAYENPDCFIFLGDGIKDILKICDKYPSLYCHIVSGNCDMIDNFPFLKEVELCGKNFYLTHGHPECVKSSFATLAGRAITHGADIALCGHTHIRALERFGDLIILKPGSAYEGNYATLDISETTDDIKYDFKNIKEYIY